MALLEGVSSVHNSPSVWRTLKKIMDFGLSGVRATDSSDYCQQNEELRVSDTIVVSASWRLLEESIAPQNLDIT